MDLLPLANRIVLVLLTWKARYCRFCCISRRQTFQVSRVLFHLSYAVKWSLEFCKRLALTQPLFLKLLELTSFSFKKSLRLCHNAKKYLKKTMPLVFLAQYFLQCDGLEYILKTFLFQTRFTIVSRK